MLIRATAVNPSGASPIDFTGIPSGAKRIIVMFSGVSTNGTARILVQLGTSGGIESSGYSGSSWFSGGSGNFGAGFTDNFFGGANTRFGSFVLALNGSNNWVCSINIGLTDASVAASGGGSKTLSGTLDRVRITTANGTDAFDAGTINILYE
jgi:hypothetical protein